MTAVLANLKFIKRVLHLTFLNRVECIKVSEGKKRIDYLLKARHEKLRTMFRKTKSVRKSL